MFRALPKFTAWLPRNGFGWWSRPKPSKKCNGRQRLLLESLEDRRVFAAGFAEFIDPNPSPGNQFGATVVPLSTGNVVVTSPFDDAGGADAGAVYLFNGDTGKLISTLTGSHPDDHVGESGDFFVPGVIELPNGNYLVLSGSWDNGTAIDAGAVTYGNGKTGLSGVVSEANSLVGSTTNDHVGWGGVTVLKNGNYVVTSDDWSNGNAAAAGAVTWGSGTSGVQGAVSAANSLVGAKSSDGVGSISDSASNFDGVVALTNGNYVIVSPNWDDGLVEDCGAVTFGDGLSGVRGLVSSANSLIGVKKGDQVGNNGVTALTNGNYVVSSPLWDNGLVLDVGAVTFGNGTTGIVGTISSANSLIGKTAGDNAGTGAGLGITGVTPLVNGNYVVASSDWDNGAQNSAGAVTFGNGASGVSGVISATNSLVGTVANTFAGNGGVTALTNGNYVVSTPNWKNGANARAGAATFGNGTTGINGPISVSNSLVGDRTDDGVSFGGITALTNGNYVVSSHSWQDGVGAVTFGNGVTGISGVVTTANSLVGSTQNDLVGGYGVTALSNGNYVVASASWNNTDAQEAGAVTFGNGTTGITGVVSAENSLVGSQSLDHVGNYRVLPLANGNYLVTSFNWRNGDNFDAGAITFGSGTSGIVGPVSAANSLVGSTSGDSIGQYDVKLLANGNYIVNSPLWSAQNMPWAGAVTFGNGLSGVKGEINSANSLVGSTANDLVGNAVGVTAFSNGNYVIGSPSWDSGFLVNAGAVTFASAASGRMGTVNSVNSAIGDGFDTGLRSIAVDDVNLSFYASFLDEGGGRIRVGSQIDGFSHPWHFSIQPQDVNNDGQIVAADVLTIINYINAGHSSNVAPDAAVGKPYGFLDVTGDGKVIPECHRAD